MQQFQIPQFINIEDKVIGPLTIKQFLWLLAGGGICFVLWTALPLAIFLILGIPIAILFLALAFFKIHGRPFIHFITSAISYFLRPKMLLFNKPEKERRKVFQEEKIAEEKPIAKATESDLEKLATKLDK